MDDTLAIRRDSAVTLTGKWGRLLAGMTGTAHDAPSTPHSWREPAVWVHWDDKTHYPRWVPARLLRVATTQPVDNDAGRC